jgi:hypothetical protein
MEANSLGRLEQRAESMYSATACWVWGSATKSSSELTTCWQYSQGLWRRSAAAAPVAASGRRVRKRGLLTEVMMGAAAAGEDQGSNRRRSGLPRRQRDW